MPDLSKYTSDGFDRGRSRFVETIWRIISAFIFQPSWVPFYGAKRAMLRLFGAKVGKGVLIKPGVRITFPWKIALGDYSWIGENVWLDSLAPIEVGRNCCISQGAYLCTGNHDFQSPHFELQVEKIKIEDGAWVAAYSVVGPGVRIGKGAILSIGSVATKNLEAHAIYRGNPAQPLG